MKTESMTCCEWIVKNQQSCIYSTDKMKTSLAKNTLMKSNVFITLFTHRRRMNCQSNDKQLAIYFDVDRDERSS